MTDGEEKAMASRCLRKEERERNYGRPPAAFKVMHCLLGGHNGIEGLKLGRRATTSEWMRLTKSPARRASAIMAVDVDGVGTCKSRNNKNACPRTVPL